MSVFSLIDHSKSFSLEVGFSAFSGLVMEKSTEQLLKTSFYLDELDL